MGLISLSFGDVSGRSAPRCSTGIDPPALGRAWVAARSALGYQFRVADLTVVPFILTNAMCDATVSFL